MGTVQATPPGVLGGAAEFLVMPRSLLGGVLTASVIDHETLGTFDRVYLPAIGLLVSLSLQLTLLLTGELRKWTGWASVPGWLAHVVADIVVVYMLGLLSRTQVPANLYGLWSAFLVYHLGGPDNFTAYERADSRLLTGIPELLPTQLDLTKELMRREFVLDIKGMKKDMKSWVDEVRQEVMGWLPPEPVTFSNIIGITGRPQDMVGFAYPHQNRDNQLEFRPADVYTCARASKYVAMMLFGKDPGSRWEVVASSAFSYIAAPAQSNNAGQHCRKLTQGRELLTVLWILSSHLGGVY